MYKDMKDFREDYGRNRRKAMITALLVLVALLVVAFLTGLLNKGLDHLFPSSAKQQSSPQVSQAPEGTPAKASPRSKWTYTDGKNIYTHKLIVEDMAQSFDPGKAVLDYYMWTADHYYWIYKL